MNNTDLIYFLIMDIIWFKFIMSFKSSISHKGSGRDNIWIASLLVTDYFCDSIPTIPFFILSPILVFISYRFISSFVGASSTPVHQLRKTNPTSIVRTFYANFENSPPALLVERVYSSEKRLAQPEYSAARTPRT